MMKNLVIIGAGPAGISAAVYAARAGVPVTVLHNNGGSLLRAEKIANFYGFASPVSGNDLYGYGIALAQSLGVEVVQCEITGISYNGSFAVSSQDRTFEAGAVVIATGAKRFTPKIGHFSDFEGKGVSYCAVCDGFFYRNKRVAVLGSGGYALAEAKELSAVAQSVTVLTDGEQPSADFGGFEVIQKKIAALSGDGLLNAVVFDGGSSLPVSGFFVAIGVAGAADLAKKLGAVTKGNYISVDGNMSTNIPGLFAAGDCTGGLLQVAKAAADGATAGIAAAKYLKSDQR